MLGVDASRDCPQKGFQAAYIVSLLLSHCHIRWSGGHVVLTALMKNPHIISFVPCHCHREASRGCWVGGGGERVSGWGGGTPIYGSPVTVIGEGRFWAL